MKSKKLYCLFLGIGAGLLGFLWLRRRMLAERPLPRLSSWLPRMRARYGEAGAARFTARLQERYAALLAQRPRQSDKILRWHLESNILPGLALYEFLKEETGSQEQALSEVEEYLRASARSRQEMVRKASELPNAPRLFPLVIRWISRLGFPKQGWDFEWLEDSNRRIAYDIHRCFYLDTLTAYGAPELTAAFCKNDDLLAEAFPSFVKFERTNTLGRGGECCDFRYEFMNGSSSR